MLSPGEYLRFEWRTVFSIYELVSMGFLGARLISPAFFSEHGVLDIRMLSPHFKSFSYTCVGNMGCTPSLCYSDVVRGVLSQAKALRLRLGCV
jgi:hypothetical protein